MTSKLVLPQAADVRQAAQRILGRAHRTPLWKLDLDLPGTNIYLKLENLQPLGSFKIRAAVNALLSRPPEALAHGVLAPSAGNFGQGLAWAARDLGVRATIVAPDTAAATKIDALRRLGAEVVQRPFADWWEVMSTRRFPGSDAAFFHPVADAAVLAGNATIGVEILEDLPQPDAVVIPFGGGGLACGIGSVLRRESPQTRILVVESEAAEPVAAAFAAGAPVSVHHARSFVDGMGSARLLDEMWPLVRQAVDGPVRVTLDEIVDAIRLLAARQKIVAEGAGAAAVAAAIAGRAGEGDIVCIVSGGNIDPAVLAPMLAPHSA